MQAFEISRFGYWISPDGEILPLELPQSHAAVILREGVFPGEVFEHLSDAVERAVDEGWIGVSIAPVGTSISVRIRDASVDVRAVRALQELVQACGWEDLTLHTEHQTGTGKELVTALRQGAFDSKTYETYEAHADALRNKLSAACQSRANLVALRDFLETPGIFSSREVMARLRHARTACDDALKSIKSYSFRNITKLETALTYAGDLHAGFLYQERIIDERLALAQSEFFANFERPSLVDPLAKFEDCAPALAVRELQREIDAVKKSESQVKAEIRTMEGGEQGLAFLTRLLVTRSSLGLVRHHMKRFFDDLGQADLTTEKVISLTQYYVAHECARTYSSNSWKPFGEMQMALTEFESAVKPQPVLGM